MVVFQENHVEEADAVIASAANLHSILLHDAHSRSGLAGVEHLGVEALKFLLVTCRYSGNAAHALHDVEHQAFSLQQRLYLALNHKGDIARSHVGTVLDVGCHFKLWIKLLKDFLCHLNTSKYAFLFDYQARAPHFVGWDAAQCGSITVANILGKRQIYQLINQFISCFHNFSIYGLLSATKLIHFC